MKSYKMYYSEHLILSHLGLASVLMLRPFSHERVIIPDFEFRTSLGTSILLSITYGSKVIAKETKKQTR